MYISKMYQLIEELWGYTLLEDGYVIKLDEKLTLNTVTRTLYIEGFDNLILDKKFVSELVAYFEELNEPFVWC